MNKKTAVKEVYDLIKGRILEGTYAAHSPVRETAVASELEVSRTPVREALRELISEGWLEAIPHAGARVAAWTARDASEVFEIRLALEPLAIRLAAESIQKETLQQLKQLAEQMESLVEAVPSDPEARNQIAALNYHFHRLLVSCCKNQRLNILLENIVPNSVIRRNLISYSLEHLRRSMQHHRELIDALQASNGDWAENIMRAHLLAARNLHLSFIEQK